MTKWPYAQEAVCYPSAVQEFCVRDAEWQTFRVSLKGLSTEEKLKRLDCWRADHMDQGLLPLRNQVQIDNYLNALKRGGQLNLSLEVQR